MRTAYLVACFTNAGIMGILAAAGDSCGVVFSALCLGLCYMGYKRHGG